MSESFQRRLNFHAWISHSQPFAKKFAANSPKHLSPIEPSAKHGWMNSLNLLAGKHSMFFRKKTISPTHLQTQMYPPKLFTSTRIFCMIRLSLAMILPGKCSFGFSCGFSSDSRDVALKLDWDFTRFLLILYVKTCEILGKGWYFSGECW